MKTLDPRERQLTKDLMCVERALRTEDSLLPTEPKRIFRRDGIITREIPVTMLTESIVSALYHIGYEPASN